MRQAIRIRAAGRRVLALALIAGMSVVPAFAQESEYEQGRLQGVQDASGRPVWLLSGLFLGPIGLILPWIISPRVPGANLVGKSADYVEGYTEGYQRTARPKNFQYSLGGCAIWGVVAVGVVLFAQSTAQTTAGAAEACDACLGLFGKNLSESCSAPSCSAPSCSGPTCSPSTPSCSSPLLLGLLGGPYLGFAQR